MSGLTVPIQAGVTFDSGASAPRKNDPERVKHATQQFEALMISQMMKSIRESEESGPMGEEKDQAGSTAMQLAEEQFAQALAARGGFGLASMFTKAFRQSTTGSSTDQASPAPPLPRPGESTP